MVLNRKWRDSGILIIAVLAAYLNAFCGSFQFDDFNVILGDPAVHSFPAWLADLRHGVRPLLKLSYLLNWVSGAGLFGFHLFNICVHAANALLIYLLSREFFEKSSPPNGTVQVNAALLAALVFALHPIQTEAVTYISGRSMSLMTLFYLGSMLAYVRGSAPGAAWIRYFLSPLLFLAAAGVKETAVTLPLALALWETGTGNAGTWKEILRKQAVHWGVIACFALYIVLHPSYFDLLLYGLEKRGVMSNLMSQAQGISYLLSRLVFLHRLNIDPDLPVIVSWSPLIAMETVFLAVLLVTGFLQMRKRPWLGFGLLWFFLHLLPTNSLLPRLDIANERHMYLAGWGIYLAAVGTFLRTRAGAGLPAFSAKAYGAAFFGVLALFTVARNHAYRNEVALWQDTVVQTPLNARAHNNLGYAYFHAGHEREALAEYREALRLRPGYDLAEKNLAAAMDSMRKNH